jgi:hypothetical protein
LSAKEVAAAFGDIFVWGMANWPPETSRLAVDAS